MTRQRFPYVFHQVILFRVAKLIDLIVIMANIFLCSCLLCAFSAVVVIVFEVSFATTFPELDAFTVELEEDDGVEVKTILFLYFTSTVWPSFCLKVVSEDCTSFGFFNSRILNEGAK